MARDRQGAAGRVRRAQVRYAEEQKEIEAKAREKEKERDAKVAESNHLLHEHHRYANAVAIFQVAIALGAVAALTRNRLVWMLSLLLGAGGAVLFADHPRRLIAGPLQVVRAGSMSTAMLRHLPWRNRATDSVARVRWPSTIASQMSVGCRPRVAWRSEQSPSGTTICETIEM